jgi:hypothetical protein
VRVPVVPQGAGLAVARSHAYYIGRGNLYRDDVGLLGAWVLASTLESASYAPASLGWFSCMSGRRRSGLHGGASKAATASCLGDHATRWAERVVTDVVAWTSKHEFS